MQAERTASGFGFFHKRVYTTRLASGLDRTGRLDPERMAQSLAVLSALAAEAAFASAPAYAYATSAVRDAENRDEFVRAVSGLVDGRIRVLSGEEEARFALTGATGGNGGLIDIGGGSAQVVTDSVRLSFPIGCVRAKDRFGAGDAAPDEILSRLTPWLSEAVHLPTISEPRFTGVGGSITTLAALSLGMTSYDPARVREAELTPDSLQALLDTLYRMGDAVRSRHPLLTERHDVILFGGTVLRYLMRALALPRLFVSDADGMEGYAMQILNA